MSWLKGVSAVTYSVRQETIRQWAWFWIVGLGGELVFRKDDGPSSASSAGSMRWRINLGVFDVVLFAGCDQNDQSQGKARPEPPGDHSVIAIDYAVENPEHLDGYLEQHPDIRVPGVPMGTRQGINFVPGARPDMNPAGSTVFPLKKIDHVTYAVTPDTIEECARFWIEGMGGTMVLRNDDVRVDDSSDSMMLWGIILNKGLTAEELGIALVAGIDKKQVSQVTRFVSRNGPNSVQHVAFDVGDMAEFRSRFEGEFGANLLSETLIVPDGFGGFVKQVFGRGYESGNAAEVGFPEFLERLDGSGKGFTNAAGEGLYEKVQRISDRGDDTPIIDFSRMPTGWEPPEPKANSAEVSLV